MRPPRGSAAPGGAVHRSVFPDSPRTRRRQPSIVPYEYVFRFSRFALFTPRRHFRDAAAGASGLVDAASPVAGGYGYLFAEQRRFGENGNHGCGLSPATISSPNTRILGGGRLPAPAIVRRRVASKHGLFVGPCTRCRRTGTWSGTCSPRIGSATISGRMLLSGKSNRWIGQRRPDRLRLLRGSAALTICDAHRGAGAGIGLPRSAWQFEGRPPIAAPCIPELEASDRAGRRGSAPSG